MARKWQAFERAVAAFIAALDPRAKVTHDARLPDRSTRRPRQRDVWIEARACGIFPIKILVSCKRLKRPLNQNDIDAFNGELLSSRAHKGVIYSYGGFGLPAIEKARDLGICCCRLYEDQAADLPPSLLFACYGCYLSVGLGVEAEALAAWGDVKLAEVFEMRNPNGTTVLDLLAESFRADEKRANDAVKRAASFPKPWRTAIGIEASDIQQPLTLVVQTKWRVYRATVEAILLNGTYSVTDDSFTGSQRMPSIDMKSSSPGLGWELLDVPPTTIEPGTVLYVLSDGDLGHVLREGFAEKTVRELQHRVVRSPQ